MVSVGDALAIEGERLERIYLLQQEAAGVDCAPEYINIRIGGARQDHFGAVFHISCSQFFGID